MPASPPLFPLPPGSSPTGRECRRLQPAGRGRVRLLAYGALIGLVCAGSAPPRRDPAVQQATMAWLSARLGVREASGRNDGPAVAALVRAGGGPPNAGLEWCGFTQAADQRAHGLPMPAAGMQGAARAWFTDAGRTYYLAGRRGRLDSIQPGDLTGFDYGQGIHHITRCVEVMPPLRRGRAPRGFYTIGGNEGRGFNAGMHRTYYPAASIAAAARWDYPRSAAHPAAQLVTVRFRIGR